MHFQDEPRTAHCASSIYVKGPPLLRRGVIGLASQGEVYELTGTRGVHDPSPNISSSIYVKGSPS